ncbi:MAG: hypothetical protein ABUM26_06880 [Solirubrobacterales bacterium]
MQLCGDEPERLLETFLRLEVARRALEPLIGHYVARDGGWKVRESVYLAEEKHCQATRLHGTAAEVNVQDRLRGRRLLTADQTPTLGSAADAGTWAAAALRHPPGTLRPQPYPWVQAERPRWPDAE